MDKARKRDDIISAFAFKTGREIEKIIQEETGYLFEENQFLKAKILRWYANTKDKEFLKFFEIRKEVSNGILEE